jgi:O-antigen/teichoic acid export membrane protein
MASATDGVNPELEDPLAILDSGAAGGRVIRGSVLRTASYAIGVGLSIVGAALMIRHLGAEDYGKYVVVISLITVVAGFTDLGMANMAARELAARDPSERRRLLANLLGIRLAIGVVGIGAATIFAVLARYEASMVIGTVLAGIGMLLTTVQHTYAIPMVVALRFGWISAIEVLRQLAMVAIFALLVLAGAGLLSFIAAAIPVAVLILVIAMLAVRGLAPLRPSFELGEWSWLVRLTGIYAAAAAVGTIYISAAVIANSLVSTSQEAGYLGAAYRIYIVLATVPLLLIAAAFPVLARAAHADRARLEYALRRVFEIAVIVGTWMALATMLGAGFAIQVVAGDGFEPAVDVLQIQGATLLPSFIATAAAFALVSLRLNVALLAANAVALTATVALTLALAPHIGAKGAAIGMLVGDSALAVLYCVGLLRANVLQLELRTVARVVIAATPAFLLALTPLRDVALVVAATIVYWGALFLLRGIPPEVMDALLHRTADA